MCDKVECPYCEFDNEVSHDDWENYTEEKYTETQCWECDKYFQISTSISYYHEWYKLPCSNCEPDKWKQIIWWVERCKYCDDKRYTKEEERKKAIEDYSNNLEKSFDNDKEKNNIKKH